MQFIYKYIKHFKYLQQYNFVPYYVIFDKLLFSNQIVYKQLKQTRYKFVIHN